MRPWVTARARPLVAVALAWTLLAAGGLARAQTPPPADPEEARLDAVFQRFDARRDVVEATLRRLELSLARVEQRLADLRRALGQAEAELAARRAELDQARAALAAQRGLLRDSAASIYMRGPWSHLNAMLNARDIGSLVRVEVYSEAVLNDFVQVLHARETAVAVAERAHASALARAEDLRRRTAEVEAEETRLLEDQQRAFGRRQRLIDDLIAEFGGLEELRKRGFDIIIRSFSGSSARIQNALREAQRGQDLAREGEYMLRWPTEDHRITSPFGWRIHPIFGYRSFHTGIDVAADYGAPVVTGLAGRAVDVGYMGAFGLVVVVDHGRSVGTVYAHLSRALVRPGDQLIEGQQVGEVGCTGWCTGPHVHFEVRLAGEPTNPILWL
jgi:murein DD-endopeptidase MepM/ murein hydrolase activator NlpD